jgi:hypothetical protein
MSYELRVVVAAEASQFPVGDRHGKSVAEEELEVGL